MWSITLTLLNELSFNVGHNTYITKHQHYEPSAYTYSSELTSVVGIFRHLRMAHVTMQRGALHI